MKKYFFHLGKVIPFIPALVAFAIVAVIIWQFFPKMEAATGTSDKPSITLFSLQDLSPLRNQKYCRLFFIDPKSSDSKAETKKEKKFISFKFLPFAVIPQGEDAPPNFLLIDDAYPVDFAAILMGLDRLLEWKVDAISLSLGPKSGSFNPKEPLQVATRIAYENGILVVVAAGNSGLEGESTLQPLAQAPWVIAVGATDPDGRLLDISSRGSQDGAHPTVVSDGSCISSDFKAGTSWAAPRVARIAIWIKKCLEVLLSLPDYPQKKWRPIKMPIVGIADTGYDPKRFPPRERPPLTKTIFKHGGDSVLIPPSDKEFRWYKALINILRKHNVTCRIPVTPSPDIVKRALQLMARPLEGYSTHEVGAGFVSYKQAEDYLISFTFSRFMQLFFPEVMKKITNEILEDLDKEYGPLWDNTKLVIMKDLFYEGLRSSMVKVTR